MKTEHDPESEAQWVDEQMARLSPPPGWAPNSSRALGRLTERSGGAVHRWSRVFVAGIIVAAAGLVLVLLPWQVLWKSAAGMTTPTGETSAAKPAEEVTVSPTVFLNGEAVGSVFQASAPKVAPSAQAPPAPETPPQKVTSMPRVIYQVQPAYTDEARAARIQGSVGLTARVAKDGTVTVTAITASLGYGLDENAKAAVEQWRFEPGTVDGVPADVLVSMQIHFALR